MFLLNLKALVVVLASGLLVFALARPAFLRFTLAEDYSRRRSVWIILTIAGFVSPSFWWYLLVAVPLVAWAGQKDSSPLALYLLLTFVIPPAAIPIPTVVIQQLFELSNARILGIFVLLPALITRSGTAFQAKSTGLRGVEIVLLLYGLLELVLLIPYESPTNTMRRGFLFLLDAFLVLFAFSRLLKDRRELTDAMGGLCLGAAILAAIGIFESLRGWLLFTGIWASWGRPNEFEWLFRDGSLRAQASTGHSINLGYMLALAIGFWMYLKETQTSKWFNVAFFGLTSTGLLFTYARGPWVMAAVVVLVAVVLGSRNAGQMMKLVLVPTLVGIALVASPVGDRIVDMLPWVGSSGQDSVTQRQLLAEVSWQLVQQHPWFGNPFVLLQMEELRTGDHIIDIVNGYAQVALFHGLVGLALFVAVFVGSLYKAYSTWRHARRYGDVAMSWLGASLVACMVASLVEMATSGQLYLQWATCGLLIAYAGLEAAQSRAVDPASYVPGRALRSGRMVSIDAR